MLTTSIPDLDKCEDYMDIWRLSQGDDLSKIYYALVTMDGVAVFDKLILIHFKDDYAVIHSEMS